MKRIFSTAVLGLALAAPVGASASNPVDEKAPEAVLAANEDAVVLPAPSRETKPRDERARRSGPRGSSQSEAGFRFTNPYAFPVQTLPIVLPNITGYSF